ncbi:MAG TPA: sugar isomerase [Rectinemataceae bacterium]|nr:sugar isomerase [Rectinemataceae bacterium]
MNSVDPLQGRYALVREMLEVPDYVRALDVGRIAAFADRVKGEPILLTGEGSSRIFPAKKTMADGLRWRYRERLVTDGATQALEYDLRESFVFIASNSGKTKEGVRLLRHLKQTGCAGSVGVVANAGTPLDLEPDFSYVLGCGPEKAVAATKSVVEQALFYDILFRLRNGAELPDLRRLADCMDAALRAELPAQFMPALLGGGLIGWAGRNDGVAEELTLKTNEITRRKADFLEGTYAAHGIEEVLDGSDVVIVIDPFEAEEAKFEEVLVRGVGLPVLAISGRPSRFPTLLVPTYGDFSPYIMLCAGWNLLVAAGIALGVDLDHPVRARKIGNEFRG